VPQPPIPLRTPEGGSSCQYVIVIDGGEARLRLLSPRECARLMGLADAYAAPQRLEPILQASGLGRLAAE
jgi:DNA (cytosine-5)-methyltransferase 1